MNVAYLRRGEGKDLVFLHGYLSCKESFYPQIGYFSRHFRVTAPDFPGFGKSDRLPAAWSVGDYADWLEGFFKEQGIVFPYVIAHSFGGRVALKCLARGLIDRAVLTGCAGIVKKRTMAYRIRVGGYRLVKRVSPRFAEAHFGSREYRSLSPLMRESYKKIVNEDLREEAGRIARPVLYLYGERDKETPLSSGRILHECTAGSKLAVFKGCGHFAHLEEPLLFNLAAEEFLDDA
ncbi:MAG: hypothetical protein DBX60_05000 [Bacillota bacterium]|nr:MAG: hypothetical protein DBX60_05000 [Bacillota bacterium]